VDGADQRDQYDVVLPFDSDAPDFVRGVEVGMVWSRLQVAGEVVATVHTSNAEMMMRMAEATGRRVAAQEINDDWLVVTFDAI
jgi:hypothetical protein